MFDLDWLLDRGENCWVCRRADGVYFIALSQTRPDKQLYGMHESVRESLDDIIPPGGYSVLYGPCSGVEARQYLDDVIGP